MIRRLRRRKQSFLLSLRSVGTTHKGTTSKIIRSLYEPYIIRPLHEQYIIRSLHEHQDASPQ